MTTPNGRRAAVIIVAERQIMSAQPARTTNDDGKPHPGRRMTEAQFHAWIDDWTRVEWVNGDVIMMPPVTRDHANIKLFLLGTLRVFAEERGIGTVTGGPYQTRLTDRHRLQPDVVFVAKRRRAIVKYFFVDGVPDLIIEVVAPGSEARDWREKFLTYQAAGVREYWVIDSNSQRVEAYALSRRAYRRIPDLEGRLSSRVLRGFFLRPEWLWMSPAPSLMSTLRLLKRNH